MGNLFDSEDYDVAQHAVMIGDNNLTSLTAFQLQKCAAIIQAYYDGHVLWGGELASVIKFLQTTAVEGSLGLGVITPDSKTLWDKIQNLPWPPVGDPKPETEHS